MPSYKDETIWIIGASSGIGRALANELSASGAKLILSARRANELEQLNSKLGGTHHIMPFDVQDPTAFARALHSLKSDNISLDRAIYMAAIYEPSNIDEMNLVHAEQLLHVNVLACFAFAKSVLPTFKTQGYGQIAICSSVAAYIGLPNGQPYSASKAALRNFTESLFSESPPNVDIKLISPGFVRSKITDKNDFSMPHIMEPQEAAKRIARGLQTKAFEIHFPKRFTWQLKILASLPYWLSLKICNRLR